MAASRGCEFAAGAKGGWQLLWRTFMQELAPQSADGDYVRPSYTFNSRIGDAQFPVRTRLRLQRHMSQGDSPKHNPQACREHDLGSASRHHLSFRMPYRSASASRAIARSPPALEEVGTQCCCASG